MATDVSQKPPEPATSKLRRFLPTRENAPKDILASLIVGIGAVPDGMATALLANMPPINGLYATIAGPIFGGATASTQRMMVTTTSATALAAIGALSHLSGPQLFQSMFLLTVLAGIFVLVAGLLKLSSLTRFVSHSVMTGFLMGLAIQIILNQLGDFVGYQAVGANSLSKAINVITNISQWDLTTLMIGVLTLVVIIGLERTRIRTLAPLCGLIIPTVIVLLFQLNSVEQVQDISAIPRGIPMPIIPDFALITPQLVVGALAVAIIVMVQSSGVTQSTPNLDGTPSNLNRDFSAQGIANVASGLLQGIPVGGSVGDTALAKSAGARSRWGIIFAGCWMILFITLFPELVSQVVMPSLAAILILSGFSALDFNEGAWIWQTGFSSRLTIAVTFIATLIFPVYIAVMIGALLSAILYVTQVSADISLIEVVRLPGGGAEERTPPSKLPSRDIIELNVYGSLFYAGARTLEKQLPSVKGSEQPVVILHLRGVKRIGATFIDVLRDYTLEIKSAGGRLYLVGLSPSVREQLDHTHLFDKDDTVLLYTVTPRIGDSGLQASEDGRAWLVEVARDQMQAAATESSSSPND